MYRIQSLFSKDLIEFRQNVLDEDLDNYEHPLLFENIKCTNCKKETSFYSAECQRWWIDELFQDCRDSNELADLCFDCRNEAQIKYSEGSRQCARCTRYSDLCENVTECMPGEEDKLILCYSGVDQLFCFSCHWHVHYNK
jgi:hypothetical protein